MRNGHIQSAKTELERLQKQGNSGGNQERIRPPPAKGTTAATRPGERDKFRPGTVLTCIGAERISDKQGVIAVLCQRGKSRNPRNFINFYQFLTRYPHNVHSHITGNELDSGFSGRTHKFR